MQRTDNIAIMALTAIAAAAFMATMTPNAYAQTSQLTVNSQLANGTTITGYYAEAVGSTETQSGFTPAPFTLNNGEAYFVGVADWLNFFFDYWLDTGSTERWRKVTVTADTQLTAIYREESVLQQGAAPPATPEIGVDYGYIQRMANRIAAYGGVIPDVDLTGYKLADGSEIAEGGSMYSLVSSGMNVSHVARAAELAGVDWESLTEAQQCYLVMVLNVDIPLDENGLPL